MSETRPSPTGPDDDATESDLPEQLRIRASKRERLLAEGTQPYPVGIGRTHALREVRETWGDLSAATQTEAVVTVAGRVVFIRNTGKLCFATLQDGFDAENPAHRLQVMLSLSEIGPDRLADWKSLVDLGDHVAVTGLVITSKRGELSVLARDWQMASKALRPMPVLHKELAEETRVRQRHVDLTVRERARDIVQTRAKITRSIRETLYRERYLEVETPVLQSIHGGAAARPFGTHLNAFDVPMTLRIALELHLKRAIVGGADRVYELGRIFRNEGVDSSHAPEFTMMEAYQAWGDQTSIAELTKMIITDAADAVGQRQITTPMGVIDLDGEWRWLGIYPGLSARVGEAITPDTSAAQLRAIAEQYGVEVDPAWDAEKLVVELFDEIVGPELLQPTFVCDYPRSAQPLARPHRGDDRLIEAFDLVIGGMEFGTGFSELIDPVIQRERLTAQSLAAAAGDPEAMQLDEDFLAALEFGAPPMGGIGIGVDRLVMLFTGVGIRETTLFPLLKPL